MTDTRTTSAAIGLVAEGVTDALNLDAVRRVSAGEPTWLSERRLAAWDAYERTPLPTTRLEEWRYTNLRKLLKLDAMGHDGVTLEAATAPVRFDPASAPAGLRAAMEEDREAAGHVVELDGRVVHVDLDPKLAQRGVVLSSLRQAVKTHGPVLEEHLATEALPASRGKFQALNAALWTDGIFLHVPQGVRLELPVRVTRYRTAGGGASFTRTLVLAEPASQVSYVDECLSDDFADPTFVSSAVEVVARAGAQVQYVSLQRMGAGVFHLQQQRTLAQRDSTLDTLNVSLGASVARTDLNAQLLGPGANSDMLGLCFGGKGQHFDHNTSQDHVAPHTRSDLLYKGALDDDARSVFRGIIKVHKGAQQTDAYQTNRNLLLSQAARADSLPNLEIEADDVRCSHGATVGQLDQEHLFYLMSRGLTRTQAERLVVLGFLGEVLSRLPLGGVVEKVTRIIAERLQTA
jgi:Fe-S cluster assembly protein SufD